MYGSFGKSQFWKFSKIPTQWQTQDFFQMNLCSGILLTRIYAFLSIHVHFANPILRCSTIIKRNGIHKTSSKENSTLESYSLALIGPYLYMEVLGNLYPGWSTIFQRNGIHKISLQETSTLESFSLAFMDTYLSMDVWRIQFRKFDTVPTQWHSQDFFKGNSYSGLLLTRIYMPLSIYGHFGESHSRMFYNIPTQC